MSDRKFLIIAFLAAILALLLTMLVALKLTDGIMQRMEARAAYSIEKYNRYLDRIKPQKEKDIGLVMDELLSAYSVLPRAIVRSPNMQGGY